MLTCQLIGDNQLELPDGEVVTLKLPVYGGARRMIRSGYDIHETVYFMRGDTVCFNPGPLFMFAHWSIAESGTPKRVVWTPLPGDEEAEHLREQINSLVAEYQAENSPLASSEPPPE